MIDMLYHINNMHRFNRISIDNKGIYSWLINLQLSYFRQFLGAFNFEKFCINKDQSNVHVNKFLLTLRKSYFDKCYQQSILIIRDTIKDQSVRISVDDAKDSHVAYLI